MIDKKEESVLNNGLNRIPGMIDFFNPIKQYLTFLMENNQNMNLVSRKMSIETVIEDHILDCLEGASFFEPYGSITDLGAGGGFPGLLLAIIFPSKHLTLIEKSPKKSLFLNGTVNYMGLKNVSLINGLVGEQIIDSEVITCRAFKSIKEILNMTTSYFSRGGEYLLYKGRAEKIGQELEEARSFKLKYNIHKIAENSGKERHMVHVVKERPLS